MNYINKGKQDILIFPKFKNMNKIQKIRKKYDELAEILPPHITIIFPSKIDFNNKEIKNKLIDIVKKYSCFKIKCNGLTFVKDKKINKYYIYLNIIDGEDMIRDMSMDIYNNLLDKEIPNEYFPHITLGTVDKIIDIKMDEIFESDINEISIEKIGENEESIIEYSIELNKSEKQIIKWLASFFSVNKIERMDYYEKSI